MYTATDLKKDELSTSSVTSTTAAHNAAVQSLKLYKGSVQVASYSTSSKHNS